MSFHPATSARRLVAWRDTELVQLGRLLQDAVQAWAAEWGLPPSWQGSVHCACASTPDAGAPWQCLAGEAGASAWLASGERSADALAQALVGAVAVTPLLRELGEACRRDQQERLLATLRLGESEARGASAPNFPGRWSGNVVAALPGGARLLIEATAVERLLRPAPAKPSRAGALVPLAHAFADLAFPLQVRLEGCDLDLGSLQDLQPGDVLRLRHRLDVPASVCGAGGDALFQGFLARSRGRRAIELVPVH